ncbi:helix-turn-helix domain-containing protein [Staphylococcus caeli]|uniref:helix-turn-helix domain-containing protein n=1 Tax=Staphylococcus caeli TaxID=2201815 RepID=UPI003F573B8D
MDYSYEIIEENSSINPDFDSINIFYVLSGEIFIKNKNINAHYSKDDFFVIGAHYTPKLIMNSGKVIKLQINRLSYNRFSLLDIESYRLDEKEIDTSIKKTYIDTIMSVYNEDVFNADISVIKLINYIRIAGYYDEKAFEYSNPLVKNVLNYINNNYKSKITLSKLADKFYVNPSYLSRIFSEAMNISLIKYIRKVKIYRLATEILTLKNSKDMKDIWKDYGYISYATYLKNFQTIFSMTPESFVRKNKHFKKHDVLISDDLYLYLKELIKNI